MLFKSHVNYALMWILRILWPIKFCKGPIKISNGPLKFGNLHVFEWDMGHWPILRAHHHFGLGLTLILHLRVAKAQMRLHLHAALSEPWLLAFTKYGSRGRLRPKLDLLPSWISQGGFWAYAISSKILCAGRYLIYISICTCTIKLLLDPML